MTAESHPPRPEPDADKPAEEGEAAPAANAGPRRGGDETSPPTADRVAHGEATPTPGDSEPPSATAPTSPPPTPVERRPEGEKPLAEPGPGGEVAKPTVEKATDAGAQPAAPATPERPPPKPAAERPARPTREAEPKTFPRNPPPPGSINEILAQVVPRIELKAAYAVPALVGDSVAVEVAPADIPDLMTAARDDERLDLKYLRSLAGVDWQEEGLEVVYHLLSMTKKHHLTVKTRVPHDDPRVPSIAAIYPAADWHERETRDMFGIDFEGHPNLVPLLLPDDMTDHFPLRKDNPLQEIEEWQGELLREGAGGDDGGEE